MYKLYVGKPQKLPATVKYAHYCMATNEMLVYAEEQPTEAFAEVSEEQQTRLNSEQRKWLTQCKIAINTAAMAEKTNEYTALLNGFLEEFEKELENELSKAKDKENGDERNDQRI